MCFSKAFPKEEYVNLDCCIIRLEPEGSISSPIRYSCLSILPNDNADIFAASLFIIYCSFASLIFSSIMISFYILPKRFFLKRKGLSDARVVSVPGIEYGFSVHFCKDPLCFGNQHLMND